MSRVFFFFFLITFMASKQHLPNDNALKVDQLPSDKICRMYIKVPKKSSKTHSDLSLPQRVLCPIKFHYPNMVVTLAV